MLETAVTVSASQLSTWVPTFLFPGSSLSLTSGSFGLVWNERQLTATGRQGEHKKIRKLCWAVWEENDRHTQARPIWIPGGFKGSERPPPPSPSAPSSFPHWNLAPKEGKKAEKLEKGMGSCQYAPGQGRKKTAGRRFNQCMGCGRYSPALSWAPEVPCRNTPALRRGQSSRETQPFCQYLWICAHTSPIFRLMNSLFFALSAWNTPEMRNGHQFYKYTSSVFIHELSISQWWVAMPRRGKAWHKGSLLRNAWWW